MVFVRELADADVATQAGGAVGPSSGAAGFAVTCAGGSCTAAPPSRSES